MSARRNLVLVAWAALSSALALGGCKAEFTSGVTVCGKKEPRCPSGYVCVNDLRCVKMGDGVNIDRNDGGRDTAAGGTGVTSGTGGTGGSSGTGGSGGGTGPLGPVMNVDAASPRDMAPPPDATAAASDVGVVAIDTAAPVDMAAIPAGQSLLKFCNGLRKVDGSSIEFELAVGALRFKAGTRQCAPVSGMACGSSPSGPVTAQLFRDGMMVASKQFTLDQGGQYLFGPDIDEATQVLTIQATKLAVGQVCASFAYPPVAKVKFCNRLVMIDDMGKPADVVLDVVIGTNKLSANTGECSTLDGRACSEVPVGPARLSLQNKGTELAFTMANLEADGNYAIINRYDSAAMKVVLEVMKLPAGQTCAAYKPPAPPPAPPADGGTDSGQRG